MTDISLDELMSGDGTAMPETTTTEIQQTELQPADTGQQRDEHGRFAPKAGEPAVVEPEQPGAIETHAENGNKVPVGAVQEERAKRQEAQRRADDLERQLAALQGQVTLLSQQRQPTTEQKPQEQQPASIWDDPDAFLKNQMTPVQQQLQETRNMLMQMQASQHYGSEGPSKVQAALEAAKKLEGTPQETALEAQIMGGGNPFINLVEWHQRQQTLSTVGNDPQAWLQAELAKLKADPAFQAEVIALARGGAVPGNRSQPVTSIPPSLSRIASGGNAADDGDVSDGALFSHATR